MRKARVKIAVFGEGVSTKEKWKEAPRFRVASLPVVNAIFALDTSSDPWVTLIHRPTGWWSGKYPSTGLARRAAAHLLKRYGKKRWGFTDPDAAKTLKDATAIIRDYEGVV